VSRKVLLALVVVALALPSAASAFTPSHVRGSGNIQPGCPTDALAANVYCPVWPIYFWLSADRKLSGTSGEFRTRWLVPGRATTLFTGRVRCLSAVGNTVVVGGYLNSPAILRNIPFVEYAVDNGASGDLVSDLGFFPFEDPDLAFLPVGFPNVCPSPGLLASIYGYLPVQSGGVVLTAGTP
jgi:hypothetical protein